MYGKIESDREGELAIESVLCRKGYIYAHQRWRQNSIFGNYIKIPPPLPSGTTTRATIHEFFCFDQSLKGKDCEAAGAAAAAWVAPTGLAGLAI